MAAAHCRSRRASAPVQLGSSGAIAGVFARRHGQLARRTPRLTASTPGRSGDRGLSVISDSSLRPCRKWGEGSPVGGPFFRCSARPQPSWPVMVDGKSTISAVTQRQSRVTEALNKLAPVVRHRRQISAALISCRGRRRTRAGRDADRLRFRNAAKPLILTKVQDLNLGTVTLGPGAWSNAVLSISQGRRVQLHQPECRCAAARSRSRSTTCRAPSSRP